MMTSQTDNPALGLATMRISFNAGPFTSAEQKIFAASILRNLTLNTKGLLAGAELETAKTTGRNFSALTISDFSSPNENNEQQHIQRDNTREKVLATSLLDTIGTTTAQDLEQELVDVKVHFNETVSLQEQKKITAAVVRELTLDDPALLVWATLEDTKDLYQGLSTLNIEPLQTAGSRLTSSNTSNSLQNEFRSAIIHACEVVSLQRDAPAVHTDRYNNVLFSRDAG